MSKSFIKHNGRGFWCPDELLEVFAYALGLSLQERHDKEMQAFGKDLIDKAIAGMPGCFDLGFDSLSPEQVSLVTIAVHSLELNVQAHPELLHPEHLNSLGTGTHFIDGIQLEYWDRLCRATMALLAGQWTATASERGANLKTWLINGEF